MTAPPSEPKIKLLEDNQHYQVDLNQFDKRVFPRVSAILDAHINKARPLMYWAANTSVAYLRHQFEECDSMEQVKSLLADSEVWTKAQKRHKEIALREADKGTRVHKVVEEIFRAELDNREMTLQIEKDIEKPVAAFLKWKEENDVHPLFTEHNVYAILPYQDEVEEKDRIGYAGRFDVVLSIDTRVKITDIKTGKAVYDEQKIQGAAYDFAFKHTHKDLEWDTDGAAILRLDKETGLPEFHDYSQELTDAYFQVFYFLCVAYHAGLKYKEMEKTIKAAARAVKKAEKVAEKKLLAGPDPF